MTADPGLRAAIEEARLGLSEGGIPIGSAIVIDDEIVGRGHNQRMQRGSSILHAEMDALENAGRRPVSDYRRATMFTTLSPCDMCSGAILLYEIPHVVIGENTTFVGAEDHLRSRGVRVDVVGNLECIDLMQRFISAHAELWKEDIGEE